MLAGLCQIRPPGNESTGAWRKGGKASFPTASQGKFGFEKLIGRMFAEYQKHC
jgi:hypothetical protein